MARISQRVSTRFEQESNRSNVKFVLASLPLAIVIVVFVIEAYRRPSKPFYNLPADITDDAAIQAAVDESGSLVPLMDMCYVVMSFCVAWACLSFYFLGYLRAREVMIENFLENGKAVLGNVVYLNRNWAFEFRYYGYCSYPHPDPSSSDPNDADGGTPIIIRKKVRIFEPYTREMVSILYLPGYPMSGQGKDDVEFANLDLLKNRSREIFLGRFSLVWTIVCASVPVYLLHQMKIVDDEEYSAGILDDYDNADKGWKVYWAFLVVGVLGVAAGGNALAWQFQRWWFLYQGSTSPGELSTHGIDAAATSDGGEDYRRMAS